MKKPWSEYNEARDLFNESKELVKAAEKEVGELQRDNQPVLDEITYAVYYFDWFYSLRRLESEIQNHHQERDDLAKTYKRTENEIAKVLNDTEKAEHDIDDALRESKGLKSAVKNKEEKKKAMEKQLEILEKDLANRPDEVDLRGLQQEMVSKNNAIRQVANFVIG